MKYLYIAIILLFANIVEAAGYTVEWGFTPPSSPAVKAYRLYKDKVKVTDFSGATTTQGVVPDGTLVYGNSFTLTAVFTDDTESPESVPFVWKEGPKIIRIVK